ncbi:MAG: metallopeptidase family protein [Actinobacteria bacterium]|nr:metallopeptidase family protein [Actinomycetota bacterium]
MSGPNHRRQRRHRDRHGRGLRAPLAPPGVPLTRSRRETFDELILDAVEDLERHWAAEIAGLEFAVEEVPLIDYPVIADYEPDAIVDRGVPLGRLVREGVAGTDKPTIVLYRRPLEARSLPTEDRADLIFSVVAELVALAVGKDVDEIDPPD